MAISKTWLQEFQVPTDKAVGEVTVKQTEKKVVKTEGQKYRLVEES